MPVLPRDEEEARNGAVNQAPERAAVAAAVPWRCSLDLIAEPPPETVWLLNGLLPAESVILFSGREGTMKTWLALDWARAIAEGDAWLGRPCKAGAVLYLDAEMPGDLFRSRLYAVGGSRNLNVWRWHDATFPTRLDDQRLRVAAQAHRFIVVDTLKRFMRGLEENSSTDMANITDALRQLTRWGATVLVLHHAPKDAEKSGYRGSTELGAGVDIALTLEKQTHRGVVTLSLTTPKTRFAEEPNLTLQVERTPSRPIFQDASAQAREAVEADLAAQLDSVAAVISNLQRTLGRHPNQSEVVHQVEQQTLRSRNTILSWLEQGEGTRWRSEIDGRSRVYRVLSLCPSIRTLGGNDGLDNMTATPAQPVPLSIYTGGIGQDRLDNGTVSSTPLSEGFAAITNSDTVRTDAICGSGDPEAREDAS